MRRREGESGVGKEGRGEGIEKIREEGERGGKG